MSNTEEEIEQIKRELQTEKKQIRQKAFIKLSNLVTSDRAVLNGILANTERDSELSYDALFYCAHEGNKLSDQFELKYLTKHNFNFRHQDSGNVTR